MSVNLDIVLQVISVLLVRGHSAYSNIAKSSGRVSGSSNSSGKSWLHIVMLALLIKSDKLASRSEIASQLWSATVHIILFYK